MSFVLADILGTKDLIGLGIVAVVIIAILVFGRKLSVSVKGVTASVEAAAHEAKDAAKAAADKVDVVAQHLGETNGDGNIARMVERVLAESAETKAELVAVNARLDERTHVKRVGRDEPEELAVYTQDRMHDILNLLNVVAMQLGTLWTFLKEDYSLPDLPSLSIPKPEDKP